MSERLKAGLHASLQENVAANCKVDAEPFPTNQVTIYRSAGTNRAERLGLKPWLETSYPWGIGPFNHGLSHIAFGPDGLLYVSSGSRTDGNETGSDPHYFTGGEVPTTACIWRINPESDNPTISVHARGLRNAYGFCWTDTGEMFATDNGPDADMPEELNRVVAGKHYGFPYTFSNCKEKPYDYTPDPPSGTQFSLPIANDGPAAGGRAQQPLWTFDAHSSPAGIAFLGAAFPPEHRGTFILARFGNLLKKPHDVGFDLLQVRPKPGNGAAEISTLLAPLGRPLDVAVMGTAIYVLEYSRQTNNSVEVGSLPGRIIELTLKAR